MSQSAPAPRPPEDGRGFRVSIVYSRFNEDITAQLLDGARRSLDDSQVPAGQRHELEVAGAIELPLATRWSIARQKVDALVCLGCVIRGETSHYDLVCKLAADGIARVSLENDIPVGLGLLTCENEFQARARTKPDRTNKGYEAAQVALEMAALRRRLYSGEAFGA